jgi:hypothetical protein
MDDPRHSPDRFEYNGDAQAGIQTNVCAGLAVGACLGLSVVQSDTGQRCLVGTACALVGFFAGGSVDAGFSLAQGAPGTGWQQSIFGKLAIPIGGLEVSGTLGSDGLGLEASRSYGAMAGAGLKTCGQIPLACKPAPSVGK